MTNHPSVGDIQSYLDGEGAFERREEIDRHVGRCQGCGREVADLRSAALLTAGTLAVLDVAVSDIDGARWRIRRAHAASRTRGFRRAAAIAASIMVVGAAGWAAAAPGSPLRSLWRRGPAQESATAALPLPAVSARVPGATVGLPAGTGSVVIVFTEVPDDAELVVGSVGPGESATVRAPESASFSTAEGRIEVDVGSAMGALSVALPDGIDAEISANGQVLLSRTAGQDAFPGPEPRRTAEGLGFTVGGP